MRVLDSKPTLNPAPRTLIVTDHFRRQVNGAAAASMVNEIRRFELFTNGRSALVTLKRPDLIIERSRLIRALAAEAELSPAAQSYLDKARVLDLALCVGADAVHPGYGFLSENADAAEAVVDTGLLFVGPPAAAIRAMGSKSASKSSMAAVGVPVAPGYHGAEQSLEPLQAEAEQVGFPLMIKPSAGGGGKGMQVVHSAPS